MGKTRTERDSFGPIEVPADRLWGANTQRSLENFPIGTAADRMPAPIIRGLALVKLAAARVNGAAGKIPGEVAAAIAAAARDVADGRHDAEFPLVIWQTGSGTQSNMNVNEVISNLAIDALGGVPRLQGAGASERSCELRPILQRQFPDRDPCRHRRRDKPPPAARPAPPAGSPGAESPALGPCREDGPHPSPGCGAPDAGPGIRRLCRAARLRHHGHRTGAGRGAGSGPGRYSRRYRPEHRCRLCREGGDGTGGHHRPALPLRPQ